MGTQLKSLCCAAACRRPDRSQAKQRFPMYCFAPDYYEPQEKGKGGKGGVQRQRQKCIKGEVRKWVGDAPSQAAYTPLLQLQFHSPGPLKRDKKRLDLFPSEGSLFPTLNRTAKRKAGKAKRKQLVYLEICIHKPD